MNNLKNKLNGQGGFIQIIILIIIVLVILSLAGFNLTSLWQNIILPSIVWVWNIFLIVVDFLAGLVKVLINTIKQA